MRIIWIVLLIVTGFAACVESEPWPEDEMDARNFPKESPGDADSWIAGTCGDNVVNAPGTFRREDCDGVNLSGETCQLLGYAGGDLACTDGCQFDVSGCDGSICGNGYVDSDETCEIVFERRVPRAICTEDTCPVSSCNENCHAVPDGSCGDGILQAPTEECEGSTFHPAFLREVPANQYDPATLRCLDCRIDYADAFPAMCGNEVLERGEECEVRVTGRNMVNESGRFACMGCRWTEHPSFCGDGIFQPGFGEECDGTEREERCEHLSGFGTSPRVPCRDCELRYDLCPEAYADAGAGVEDAGGAAERDARVYRADSSPGDEPDTEAIDVDEPVEVTAVPQEAGGCALRRADADTNGNTWLLLLVALIGIRRRTTRSRDSLCASAGSYSSL